jgi:hypothetical protein
MSVPARLLVASLALAATLPGVEPAVVPAAVPTATTTDAQWSFDPADQAEITRLIDVAVAHGYPDAAGAQAYEGELIVSGQGLQRVGDNNRLATSQSITSNLKTGKQVVRGTTEKPEADQVFGLHLKLVDGRWLVGLDRLVAAADVDASRLTALSREEFATALRDPFGSAPAHWDTANEIAWEQHFPAALRPALRASRQWDDLSCGLRLQLQREETPMVLHFMRCGVPGSDSALVRAMLGESYERAVRSDDPAPALLLTDADRQRGERQAAARLRQRLGLLSDPDADRWPQTLDPPGPLVRRTLGAWFRTQLVVPFPAVTALQAQAALQALYGSAMPEAMQEDVRRLVARAALLANSPASLLADAPFALRVAWWEPPDRRLLSYFDLNHLQDVTADQLAGFGPELRGAFAQARANAMAEGDIPALIALCGDTGASRWLDDGGAQIQHPPLVPRTVGDNALRILTQVLGVDPRALIGGDPTAPWTPAAQAASAAALQTWWQAHATTPLLQSLVATVPNMDVGAAGRLIRARPLADQEVLCAALVAHWREHPPLTASTEAMAEALITLGDVPAVAEVMRALPVSGEQRQVLATWHACHGEQRYFDQLLEEALAVPVPVAGPVLPEASDAQIDADIVMALALRVPSSARVTRLLTAAAAPLDHAESRRVLGLTFVATALRPPVFLVAEAASRQSAAQGAELALRRVLQLALLGDVRPAPAGLLRVVEDHLELQVGNNGLYLLVDPGSPIPRPGSQPAPVLPADLRLCDVAACAGCRDSWQWGLRDDHGSDAKFDVLQPLAAREAVLIDLRQRARISAEQAFSAAKLPRTLLPKVGLPAAAAGAPSTF